MYKIGNAPVSYGAFEVTVGKREGVPSAAEVLDAVQAAGYEGIDLGPVGYLGLGSELKSALGSRGLLLCGGYVEIDVSSGEAGAQGFAELGAVCDQIDAVAGGVDKLFLPRPTVALIGAPEAPARWSLIESVVGQVVSYCSGRGYEAVLHNEVGTQLAAQDDLVRVLESTGAALCLDTGHLVAAGGDPLAILAGFWPRISHVHLKDSTSAGPFTDAMQLWEGDVFCPLGQGVGRVDEVLDALRAGDYSGWLLVEQDVLPGSPQGYAKAAAEQAANRAYLRERGW
ncbi:MAG TPA: TIM barrel protein [Streptosporangiaceae bacterium]|nr:TIM barrel protein [Streptosporangiaceae bacterium]